MFEQFIGTKPVEDRHRIDVAALEEYPKLRARRIEQFKGGQSNPTYRITAADGRRFVLRRKPPGKLLPSAKSIACEYRAIQTMQAAGFPIDNAIFDPSEPKILAVLDWELSTLGDPLADFAYHCMSWHIPPGAFRGIAGLDLHDLGIPSEEQYVAMYCKRTGRQGIDRSHWDFYLAYNLFRMAAILQGILKRVVDGTAASAHARDAGMRARPMAELGWKQVEKILRRAA